MLSTFTISDLISIFRAGLVVLIPIAERARIPWREPHTYDPWENIERVLFNSIIASVVENAVPDNPHALAKYGLSYLSYSELSFITDGSLRQPSRYFALVDLATTHEPFDTMNFVELDAGFVPSGPKLQLPLDNAKPVLAARIGGEIRYWDAVQYEE